MKYPRQRPPFYRPRRARMIRCMLWNVLLLTLVLLAVGAIAGAATAYFMARLLLCPPRMTDGKAAWVLKRLSPGDLGLPFQNVTFHVRDEDGGKDLELAGWWIGHPESRGRCVILLHGYADAKVGALAWAPLLHGLGMNILAVDLRAHGESGGVYCTAGYYERHDISQVIDQIRQHRPDDTRQVALLGISIGAAIASACAVMRNDLAAVVLDSPANDHISAAGVQGRAMGSPGWPLQPLSIRLAEWMSHANFSEVRAIDTMPRIPCPLMVIQSEQDPLMTPAQFDAMQRAVEQRDPSLGQTVYWRVPDAGHIESLHRCPEEYHRRVGEFLTAQMPPGSPVHATPV